MAELPAGTVTFLFTDIEESTRLLKQLRERYEEALAEHDRILRTVIAEAGGHVVDTQGDAFFAAFPRARAAIAAAVAAQRALAGATWPEGVAVKVRMGIHTGEPAVGSDRYVGIGVHRASRICSAAHGGQVLLSGATREIVEDELPSDSELRDLGEHRLKDIDRPEHLFQLVATGLESDFPPPRLGGDGAAAVELAEAVVARRGLHSRRRAAALAGVAVASAVALALVLLVAGRGSHAAGVAANSVAFLGANGGGLRNQVSVDEQPSAVAFGEGAVWSANSASGTVSRIDPVSRTVRDTIPVGSSPSGIAVGGGGVWVANHDDNTVSWISPQSNTEVRRIPVGAGPTAVAYGAGSVWVANSDDRTMSRIDPRSGAVVKVVHTDAIGRGIAVGGGVVWVTDEATRSVLQVEPATNLVVGHVNVGTGPTGVAYGGGSVWVANALDGTVSQVDPSTLTVRSTIPVEGGPAGIAFGDGSVWVIAEFGERIDRIDPVQARVADSTTVGNRPAGVAAGDGGVWIAVQESGAGHRGSRLVVVSGRLGTIDPSLQNFTTTSDIFKVVYDGLTGGRRVGGAGGTQLVPDLAAALPLPTDGGKSYTFQLRPGIRYSDGTRLRAMDFRRALERGFELASPSVGPDYFGGLVGASSCVPHRPCNLERGIVVQGSDTVTFRLQAPDPRFLLNLQGVYPIPPGTPARDIGTKPVPATGAYAIESYAPGKLLTLTRNRYFHVWSEAARPDGYPDEIVWRILPDPASAAGEVLKGKADLLYGGFTRGAQAQKLKDLYPQRLRVRPQNATVFVHLNVRRPPFDDVRVRRALNYAVDRKYVAGLRGRVLAQLTCQLVPPSVPGYAPYCPYTIYPTPDGEWKAPDVARARALIRASGTRGQSVVVWTGAFFTEEARYLVGLLGRLGYHARLHYVANSAGYFHQLLAHPEIQASFLGWFGTQLAADMFAALRCGNEVNLAYFCDHRIDAQVARLTRRQSADPAAAAKLAARIDRELVLAAPWVPLFTPRIADFTSARVGNFQWNAWSQVLLEQLWVR
jgi:YVTN family beta-propeller protein